MKFRELFERYKNNDVTPEEKEYVENCMEKYEILTENYLEEDLKAFEHIEDESLHKEEETDEIKKIRKSLRRQRLTIILAASIIAVALLGVSMTYNSKVITFINRNLYKELEAHTYSDWTDDLSIVFNTYFELHVPGKWVQYVDKTETGIGQYDLTFVMNNLKGDLIYDYGSLNKGQIEYRRGLMEYPHMNAFAHGLYMFMEEPHTYQKKEILNALSNLPEHSYATAHISFHDDLSIEKLSQLIETNPDCSVHWVAVRSSEKDRQQSFQIGFKPGGSQILYENINETYPEFINWENGESPEVMTQHFKSLLQFMIDHQEFVSMINGNPNYTDDYLFYQEVLELVENNGLESYGIIVHGAAEDLLKLCEDENICEISIDEITLKIS